MTENDKAVSTLHMESVRLFHTLRKLLLSKGYVSTANDTNLVWSFVDSIMLAPENYTVFDWLEDTEENYPECLEPGYKE